MKIVEIDGGLGNQMCQYVFARFLEINFGYDVWFDDIAFNITQRHNGYEIGRLFENAKVNLFKKNLDVDVWNQIILTTANSNGSIKLPNVLLGNGMEIAVVADEYLHSSTVGFGHGYDFDGTVYKVFSNQMLDLNFDVYSKLQQQEHVYFMGIWINENFCKAIKKTMVHELKFPEIVEDTNIAYKEDILSKEISVGLHVRRGDFITVNKDIPPAKFAKAVKDLKFSLIRDGKPKAAFFVFSDDITWCKANVEKLGFKSDDYVVFIEGNDVDSRHYIDMQLMTFCDYLIHNVVSTFCMGAAFASEKDIVRITCC